MRGREDVARAACCGSGFVVPARRAPRRAHAAMRWRSPRRGRCTACARRSRIARSRAHDAPLLRRAEPIRARRHAAEFRRSGNARAAALRQPVRLRRRQHRLRLDQSAPPSDRCAAIRAGRRVPAPPGAPAPLSLTARGHQPDRDRCRARPRPARRRARPRRRRNRRLRPAKPERRRDAGAAPRRAIRWCAFPTARRRRHRRHGEHHAADDRDPRRCCAAAPPSRRTRSRRSAGMRRVPGAARDRGDRRLRHQSGAHAERTRRPRSSRFRPS